MSTRRRRATRCGRCRGSTPTRPSSPRPSTSSSTSSAAVARTSGRPGRRRGRPAGARAGRDRPHAQAPDSADPARQFDDPRPAARATASAELLAMVEGDPATHGQLAAAIGCSAAWLPGRERTKTNNIRVHPRDAHVHARVGSADGRARRVRRDRGLRVRAPGGDDDVARRPALVDRQRFAVAEPSTGSCRSWSRRSSSSVAPTAPTPGRDATRSASSECRRGDTVVGMPGCPGVAEGIARVVLDSTIRPRWSRATC